MFEKKPIIYSFLDYRSYLREYHSFRKKNDPVFTYRYFSRQAGVKAPNFLQWLIEGKRNLAKKTIPAVAKALELDRPEEEYFNNLVLFNQAETIREKERYFEKLIRIHKPAYVKSLTQVQYRHYNQWYNEAIRELLHYYKFYPAQKYAFRKLGKSVSPAISEKEARLAIRQLLDLGLVKKNNGGRIVLTEDFITTGDEIRSFFVQKFHENMITLARESMDRFPSESRDVSSVTMSVSNECFALIKKEIQQTRKRVMDLVKMDRNPDSVYQFNMQLFPLVPKKKRSGGSVP